MAVLGRLLISSGERLDLPDILSIDSYAAGDWKYFLKAIVGDDKPYVLKGFDVIDPQNAIGTAGCAIRVADSVVFYPGSKAGPFFHGLQEGHPQAAPLVPELRKNAINYVYLTLSTFNTSNDTRAFWDPDKDGGAGGEFSQDVNTESVLKAEINVSTGSFPKNTIPIAIIKVGPAVIESIEDARDMMFRLGSGGLSPDPFNEYKWKGLPTNSFKRAEPPTSISSPSSPNPFQGADKNIHSLKEWMDAVMTKLKEIGGSSYWYEDVSTYSLISTFIDSSAVAFRSKGKWDHATPGVITWTEDIHLKVTSDPRTYIVRAGTKTLADEQVAYVPLIRNEKINAADEPVQWTNGQQYVNTVGGILGRFANLAKGDWIKKIDDGKHLFLRVEEFYDGLNATGSPTIPANAKSILLSGNYAGTTEIKRARYDKGVYDASDVLVSNRNNPSLTTIGGNFNWLAIRADTVQNISNITPVSFTVNITNHDGSTAKVSSSSPHGLVDGDRVTISGSSNFNGTYEVEVESTTVFYITKISSPFPDEIGVNCSYAIVTTTTRSTPYGLQLESAAHGFNSNDTIEITGTSAYNGDHVINVRSPTSFTIPVSFGLSSESTGSATLKKIIVRKQGSVTQLIQGQSANIGGTDAENIRQYVGMQSMSAITPEYTVPSSYNTLDGMGDFNSTPGENLTVRIAKLTAMMADKAQDKTIKFCPADYYGINNTTNGSYQDIQFLSTTPPARLDIVGPGGDSNILVTILLNGTLSLGPNQVAYFLIDRNVTSAITISSLNALGVADIKNAHVHENMFIFAVRLGTQDVWLWDGTQLLPNITTISPTHLQTIIKQNNMAKMVRGGMWTWNLLTNTLSWSLDAFIQVPSLNENRNRIATGSVVLPNDGDVAYVDINRFSGPPSTLTVLVGNISSLPLDNDRFIIARRLGNSVDVGTGTILLQHGESRALDYEDDVAKVSVVNITSTSLPTGPSVLIDGVSLSNGQKVLFTNPSLNGVYMVSGIGTSATWTKLNVFAGSDVPYEGAMVVAQQGSVNFRNLWIYSQNTWKQLSHSGLEREPTGFENRIHSTISFNDSTRTFTIQPTGFGRFDVYQQGVPYRFLTAQTVTIPNTSGLHHIYFNNGVLQSTTTASTQLFTDWVYVASVYWDAVNGQSISLNDERHGVTLDGQTHLYLHQNQRTLYRNGLEISNFSLNGDGSTNSHAQFGVSSGSIVDEDIVHSIIHSASPANPFEQILTPTINTYVIYRSGASGAWVRSPLTSIPVLTGSSRMQYNSSSPSWGLTQASADNMFIATWVVATNNQSMPIMVVLGQREDNNLDDARTNNRFESLNLGDFPVEEVKPLYRLIYRTSSAFTNTSRAALVDIKDLRRTDEVVVDDRSQALRNKINTINKFTGMAVSQGQPVYLSVGAGGGDTSRTVDRLYVVEPNVKYRDKFWGVAVSSAASGAVLDVAYNGVITIPASLISGGSFSIGRSVYWDGSTYNHTYTQGVYVGEAASSDRLNIRGYLDQVLSDFYTQDVANNQTSPANINNLLINESQTDFAKVEYLVERSNSGIDYNDNQDNNFNVNAAGVTVISAEIRAAAIDYSGNLYIGGDFIHYKGINKLNRFVKLDQNGNIVNPFTNNASSGEKFNGSIYAIAIDSLNNVYVGGLFTNYNGAGINYLVKLDQNGNVVNPFTTNASVGSNKFNQAVASIAIDSSNNVYIGGAFTNYNGAGINYLVKLDQNGNVVNPFTNNASVGSNKFSSIIRCITIDSSDNVYVGGNFTNYNSAGINRLVKLDQNGNVVDPFTTNASVGSNKFNQPIYAIAIDSLNNVYISGLFTNYNGAGINYLVKLDQNGNVVNPFTTNASVGSNKFSGIVLSIAIDQYNDVYLSGFFWNYNSANINNFVKLDQNGNVVNPFTNNASVGSNKFNNGSYKILIDSFNNVYACGIFKNYNNMGIDHLVKLDQNGNIVNPFTLNASDGSSKFVNFNFTDNIPRCIKADSYGNVYLGGDFKNYSASNINYLVKLDQNGNVVNPFTTNASVGSNKFNSGVRCIAIDSLNNVYIGGNFTNYNSAGINRLVKLDQNGNVVNPFTTNASVGSNKFNSGIMTIAIDSSDNVYVGGFFTNYNGAGINHLVKLDQNGNVVDPFTTNASVGSNKFNQAVISIAIDSSNNVYIGGSFTNYNSAGINYLVKLDQNGNVVDPFTTNASVGSNKFNQAIYTIAIDSLDNVYVGGMFTNYTVSGINYLVKLDQNGNVVNPFTNNASNGYKFNSIVHSIHIGSNNSIYVGGAFIDYINIGNNRLCKLDTNTGILDSIFSSKIINKISGPIYSISFNNNKIFICGVDLLYNDINNSNNGTFDYIASISNPIIVNINLKEQGELMLAYDDSLNDWVISNGNILGNAGIDFDVTPTGQITYTTTNISGPSYSGTIKYRVKYKHKIT